MSPRRAGQYARETMRRDARRALAAVVVAVTAAGVAGWAAGIHSGTFIVTELAALAALFAVNRFAVPVIDRRDRGATGEEHVGKLLVPLEAAGWHTIHDVNTGRGNIDTIVIGPGGLFTVEVKSHGGKINVDRIDEKMLKQAYAQKKWLESVSGEKVTALLVFSRAYLVGRPVSRQRGVTVLPARMLVNHLRDHRAVVMTPDNAARLHGLLVGALEVDERAAA